jgi:hypothetical protein
MGAVFQGSSSRCKNDIFIILPFPPCISRASGSIQELLKKRTAGKLVRGI